MHQTVFYVYSYIYPYPSYNLNARYGEYTALERLLIPFPGLFPVFTSGFTLSYGKINK